MELDDNDVAENAAPPIPRASPGAGHRARTAAPHCEGPRRTLGGGGLDWMVTLFASAVIVATGSGCRPVPAQPGVRVVARMRMRPYSASFRSLSVDLKGHPVHWC